MDVVAAGTARYGRSHLPFILQRGVTTPGQVKFANSATRAFAGSVASIVVVSLVLWIRTNELLAAPKLYLGSTSDANGLITTGWIVQLGAALLALCSLVLIYSATVLASIGLGLRAALQPLDSTRLGILRWLSWVPFVAGSVGAVASALVLRAAGTPDGLDDWLEQIRPWLSWIAICTLLVLLLAGCSIWFVSESTIRRKAVARSSLESSSGREVLA